MRKKEEKKCSAFCLQRKILTKDSRGFEQLIITRIRLSVSKGTMDRAMSQTEVESEFPGWQIAGFMSEEDEE